MPSFDIVSKVDVQLLDNAINSARKEYINRWDFRDSKTTVELDKKNYTLVVHTENDMRLEAVVDIIRSRLNKQGIDPRCLDEGKQHYASGNMVHKDLTIKQGIDKDTSRKIMKDIKDSKLKVTPQIMDDLIRVSAKKIDDLQGVIAITRKGDYGLPLQFINMKS